MDCRTHATSPGGELPFYNTLLENFNGTSPSFATRAANLLQVVPMTVPFTMTINGMIWATGDVAAGNVYATIYRDTGAIAPGAQVWVSAVIALAGVNIKQIAVVPATRLTKGLYWLGLVCSSVLDKLNVGGCAAASSVYGNPGGQDILPKYFSQALGAFVAPPNPFAGLEATGGNIITMPWISLRVLSVP